jgi:hypothetical protein
MARSGGGMNAQEVAIKLLNAWKKDPPPPLSPNELHARHFLDDVCAYLGVAATDANKVQYGLCKSLVLDRLSPTLTDCLTAYRGDA